MSTQEQKFDQALLSLFPLMALQYSPILIWLLIFSSVFTCEDTASIPTVDSTSSPPLDDSIEITPEIVFSKLTALQSSISPGPDGWPITIIKSVSEFISVPLCILFN